MLLFGCVQVILAFLSTVLNWQGWMPIIVFPFLVAFFTNLLLRRKDTSKFPVACIVVAVALFIMATVQFLGIVTNPFVMPMTPASLAIPLFMIAVSLAGVIFGYNATTKTKQNV